MNIWHVKMYDFRQRKFISLPLERQHRRCASLLRRVYDLLHEQQFYEQELNAYNQLAAWMKEPSLKEVNFQTLSNRYHKHLEQAQKGHKEYNLLPRIRTGDRPFSSPRWPINIYLDHVRSAHNVGSILRTVEAFNLGTVYFSEQVPFKDHKQVQNAAMGAHAWVECYQGISLSTLTKPIIVLETSPDAISLYDFIFPNQFTLVMGNEEYGCSEEVLKQADYLLEIPLRGHKNSLNVANAFAITAGEIYRQKQEMEHT